MKEQVKAEQMWGDFDMLGEEEEEGQPHGEPGISICIHSQLVC